MKKRLFAMLLTLAMVFTFMPALAFADAEAEGQGEATQHPVDRSCDGFLGSGQCSVQIKNTCTDHSNPPVLSSSLHSADITYLRLYPDHAI